MDHNLTTERRNPASEALDQLSALEIVRLMNVEDHRIAPAVGCEAPAIAAAIDVIAACLRQDGRLIYLGAGTSGRLGVLDAVECPPTFNSPPGQVVGLIAGGDAAIVRAVEGAEDRIELAIADLDRVNLSASDAVVGIASSGRTPYVVAGLDHARKKGAATISISCNDSSTVSGHAEIAITPIVGAEVLSGSTRLKAGTATKMVLNMLTTGAMVLLGKTFGNLMVDLRATNEKLRARTERIVRELTGASEYDARILLCRCNFELKTAVVAHRHRIDADAARELLNKAHGHLRTALVSGASENSVPAAQRSVANDLVIGVDAGGTHVAACVAKLGANGVVSCIGRATAGAANPHCVGWQRATHEIEVAIRDAKAAAGMPESTTAAMVTIAAAGVGRPAERRRMASAALARNWAAAVDVVDDSAPILAAGTPHGYGIAVISGTGSLVVGRTPDGHCERALGWGPLLGDEGSGYAIAVDGLRSVARACDGVGPTTQLVDALFAALDIESKEQLIPAIYAPAFDRARVAALAELVVEVAESGDRVARAIVDAAAATLATAVMGVVERLVGANPRFADMRWPIAAGGGVLVHSLLLRDRLTESLARAGVRYDEQIVAVGQPEVGAARIAARLHALRKGG
ncbi:MAG: N-acetylmuramic acid 6-phosphate etherase [Planctomycetota bacterium]|nr:MAG: N-acetylmuramic acid 6-phosphate etherase [Planctomycetota bacterium]